MKKRIFRIIAALLVLNLLAGIIPTAVIANEPSVEPVQITQVNPLYKEVITEEDLLPIGEAPSFLGGEPVYETEKTVIAVRLRNAMVERIDTVTLYYRIPRLTNSGGALMKELVGLALAHTGEPIEGDYLAYQYAGWNGRMVVSEDEAYEYLELTYRFTYYTSDEQEALVTSVVDELLYGLDLSGMTDYQKIKTVYDYMCENISYDYAHMDSLDYKLQFTAYAALINKTAVCQGYAVLLYRLMLELGIDCRVIPGVGNGTPHAWNIIKIGNSYYNMDTTWDAGATRYDYFLRGSDHFPNHYRDTEWDASAYSISAADYELNAEDPNSAGTCGDNLTWSLSADGMLTISGSGEMYDYLEQDADGAPWKRYCKQITGITVTEGVSTIGDYAFNYCAKAKSVSLPESLNNIGKGAFMECCELVSVEVPDGIVSIEESTFACCYNMKSVILPVGLKNIGERAFIHCYSLEEIILPESLETIAEGAFYETAFPEITIPASVTELDRTAFVNNTDLRHIWVDEANPNFSSDDSGVLFSKDQTKLLLCPQGFEEDYKIPSGVTEIADTAFAHCFSLKGVTIPGTVVNMGKHTFMGCVSLENVTLEEGITTITEGAFSGCDLKEVTIPASVTKLDRTSFEFNEKLTHFRVDEANPVFSTDDRGILLNKDKSKLILCPPGFEGAYEIPDSITEIAEAAFAYCYKLTDITIPGTVTAIGARTFNSCYLLENVTLEEGVTTIPRQMFLFCTGLQQITIPVSVTAIGFEAFACCSSLTLIYFEGNAPSVAQRVFAGVEAIAFYPLQDDTYTEAYRQNHGGWITWYPLCPGHTYTDEQDLDCDICGAERSLGFSVPMYRLYNPNTGEHFYTGSVEERDNLMAVGWNYEGVAWNAPTSIGLPVYRLFNPNNSDHHYTMSIEERDNLVELGWQYEGVAWNSGSISDLPLYRLYNPNADCGSHHYTGSVEERDNLVEIGWIYEGIGWYGKLT